MNTYRILSKYMNMAFTQVKQPAHELEVVTNSGDDEPQVKAISRSPEYRAYKAPPKSIFFENHLIGARVEYQKTGHLHHRFRLREWRSAHPAPTEYESLIGDEKYDIANLSDRIDASYCECRGCEGCEAVSGEDSVKDELWTKLHWIATLQQCTVHDFGLVGCLLAGLLMEMIERIGYDEMYRMEAVVKRLHYQSWFDSTEWDDEGEEEEEAEDPEEEAEVAELEEGMSFDESDDTVSTASYTSVATPGSYEIEYDWIRARRVRHRNIF